MELHNYTTKRIFKSTKNKDGSPILSFGKPATKFALQFNETGDIWYSSYPTAKQDDPLFSLEEGVGVEVITWQNGNWHNFKLPNKQDKLELRIQKLEEAVFENGNTKTNMGDLEEIKPENLPF
jgi:hypothetical protein